VRKAKPLADKAASIAAETTPTPRRRGTKAEAPKAAEGKPGRGTKLTAMKIVMLGKPNATVEEVIGGMKELGAEPSTPSTIQTVRADLRHTLKVLLDHFDGKVPVGGLAD
jgi:hypothetical protein